MKRLKTILALLSLCEGNPSINCFTGPLEGNPPVTGGFPFQRASNARPLLVSFLLVWISFWTDSQVVSDLRHLNVHVMSSMQRHDSLYNTCLDINTLGLKQNNRHIVDNIFKCIFLNENVWLSIEISLTFVPREQLTILHHWFRQWFGTYQVTSHYLHQWWLVYWCIYASLSLNELIQMVQWSTLGLQMLRVSITLDRQGWGRHEVNNIAFIFGAWEGWGRLSGIFHRCYWSLYVQTTNKGVTSPRAHQVIINNHHDLQVCPEQRNSTFRNIVQK